ncbi:hypothetical protein HG421_20075 [Xanthomonas campestris pv. badrii]|uniref:Flagellar FliJ protein n=1 Tax=Xanthomonas campestris pv. badrii TaxID=149696 RepID=A0A7Z2VDQ3_XANCA|nr:hypothetical protein [Xanthomonas campestris]QJD69754.1 hypothetical protein HG421_20075 [Xanthomonas campestris pv. badrii]
MSDENAGQKLPRLAVLVRIRDLQARKASLALRGRLLDVRAAQAHVELCDQRVDAVVAWKHRADNGLLQLGSYQLALDIESVAHVEQMQASLDASACEQRLNAARVTYRDACAEQRAVDERHQRLAEQALRDHERSESDAAAELWLARRTFDGH